MRMKKNNTPRENLFTAIVVVKHPNTLQFLRYHRILDRPAPMKRFTDFLDEHFPTWQHVNYYGGISKTFVRQQRHYEYNRKTG